MALYASRINCLGHWQISECFDVQLITVECDVLRHDGQSQALMFMPENLTSAFEVLSLNTI